MKRRRLEAVLPAVPIRAATTRISALALAVVLAACATSPPAAELLPGAAEFAGREVEEVRFVNAAPFSADTLSELVETRGPSCTLLALPPCIPGIGWGEDQSALSLELLRRDIARLELFYRRSGFFGTEVDLEVTPVEGDDGVVVGFVIERGERVVLDSLAVTGAEDVLDSDSLARTLPLQPGELFDLGEFEASGDSIRQILLRRGYIEAQVLRNFLVDTVADLATARFVAVPGPQITVDTILVFGADDLGREGTLRQLTFDEGDLLTPEALTASQRNLYGLDIVRFAAVEIAADSLQLSPEERVSATVAVRISETPVHVVEALVGYGTVECFRAHTQWVSRSFGGGATRLEITGSLSNIGIGPPLELGGSVCEQFRTDAFRETLDYRAAATLTEPAVLNPRNRAALNVFVERQSEPSIYQRTAQGGQLSMTQGLGSDGQLSATLTAEHRQTLASDVIVCVIFLVCGQTARAAATDPTDRFTGEARWQNSIAFRYRRDGLGRPLQPDRSRQLELGVEWSAGWLGSDADFVRGTGELSTLRRLGGDWVLAGRVRLGTFFGSAELEPGTDLLAPEDRFFTGGAASVRGYRRNELGPGVYVATDNTITAPVDPSSVDPAFIPTGGTGLAVLNAELRIPAFFSPQSVRLAFFVDAGAVAGAPGDEKLWKLDPDDFRLTPGVGVRVQTPVGPLRLDLAYNPYGHSAAPLLVAAGDELRRVTESFQQPAGSFFERLRLHLAVGQPF